ncbi:hypothetical protein ACIGEZ_29225 [Streptomyces sp. NPDC085481]|uniref:hypothetical protein n=1 Tax=Streptomyces sp. NPDC085481 TaxID=3365727 RepID=UPI0037D8F32C
MTVPFAAYADSVGVTVRTPGSTAGPAATFAEISTDAACSSGLISGGGISQTIGTGTTSNGNKINGTVPSPEGSTEYLGSTGVVGTDVTHWLGIGGSGGAVNASFSSTPYAMCFSSGLVGRSSRWWREPLLHHRGRRVISESRDGLVGRLDPDTETGHGGLCGCGDSPRSQRVPSPPPLRAASGSRPFGWWMRRTSPDTFPGPVASAVRQVTEVVPVPIPAL